MFIGITTETCRELRRLHNICRLCEVKMNYISLYQFLITLYTIDRAKLTYRFTWENTITKLWFKTVCKDGIYALVRRNRPLCKIFLLRTIILVYRRRKWALNKHDNMQMSFMNVWVIRFSLATRVSPIFWPWSFDPYPRPIRKTLVTNTSMLRTCPIKIS